MSTALTQGIRFFTRETGILSALAAACGTESRTETAMDGNCASTSVFDLASVTKMFIYDRATVCWVWSPLKLTIFCSSAIVKSVVVKSNANNNDIFFIYSTKF